MKMPSYHKKFLYPTPSTGVLRSANLCCMLDLSIRNYSMSLLKHLSTYYFAFKVHDAIFRDILIKSDRIAWANSIKNKSNRVIFRTTPQTPPNCQEFNTYTNIFDYISSKICRNWYFCILNECRIFAWNGTILLLIIRSFITQVVI